MFCLLSVPVSRCTHNFGRKRAGGGGGLERGRKGEHRERREREGGSFVAVIRWTILICSHFDLKSLILCILRKQDFNKHHNLTFSPILNSLGYSRYRLVCYSKTLYLCVWNVLFFRLLSYLMNYYRPLEFMCYECIF